jgi:hypothetical protein
MIKAWAIIHHTWDIMSSRWSTLVSTPGSHTIEEGQQEIRNTLHQHSQWQEEAGQRLAAI